MWTYWTLAITGDHEDRKKFLVDHGINSEPFSFSVVAPVGTLEDDAVLKAWGCGPPEILEIREPHGAYISLKARTYGGPPTTWLRRAASKYKELTFSLQYVTEATEVTGTVTTSNGITKTSETEGDPAAVEHLLAKYLQ